MAQGTMIQAVAAFYLILDRVCWRVLRWRGNHTCHGENPKRSKLKSHICAPRAKVTRGNHRWKSKPWGPLFCALIGQKLDDKMEDTSSCCFHLMLNRVCWRVLRWRGNQTIGKIKKVKTKMSSLFQEQNDEKKPTIGRNSKIQNHEHISSVLQVQGQKRQKGTKGKVKSKNSKPHCLLLSAPRAYKVAWFAITKPNQQRVDFHTSIVLF